MTTLNFFDSCVSLIEKELLLESSNEKEKIIDKFINNSDFQKEVLKKCNLPYQPNTMTHAVLASLIIKYASH